MVLALSSELLTVLAAGALCGLWVVFQQWISRIDPDNQGVRGSCGACSGGVCQGSCGDGDGGGGEIGGGEGAGERVLSGRFREGEG